MKRFCRSALDPWRGAAGAGTSLPGLHESSVAPVSFDGNPSNRSILLATFGTLGDLHPFIALAKGLQRAGLHPRIATLAMYRDVVEGEGLDFVPMRPDEPDIADALGVDIADLFKLVQKDPHFILDEIYLRFLPETYADVRRAAETATMIIAHSLLLGAHLAAEKMGLPAIRVALSPIHLQSALAPSLTRPLPYVLQPRTAGTRAFNCALREILRQSVALRMRPLHAFRRQIGLLPSREDFYLACGRPNSAAAMVGLYSPRFAARAADHPANTRIVGFPFYRSTMSGKDALPDDLKGFLASGPPPIVFTLGSFAIEAAGPFYENSIDAARRLGHRAILLAGSRNVPRLAAAIGPDEFVCAYAPHDLLFSRALCVVHHGGMGTTAEALRSGRPQLVVPFFGDQFDHAARVERLGMARVVRPAAYTGAKAADLIAAVLRPDCELAAHRFAEALAAEDGVAEVVDLIAATIEARAGG